MFSARLLGGIKGEVEFEVLRVHFTRSIYASVKAYRHIGKRQPNMKAKLLM